MAEFYMQRPNIDPYQVRKYVVRIDGVTAMSFSKIDPIEEDAAVSTYREGNDPDYVTKQPGMLSYKEINLEKGAMMGGTSFLYSWNRNKTRKTIEIARLNHEGDQEGPTYRLYNAFPKNFKSGDFDASSEDGLAIESMTVEYEWMERI